MGSYEFAYYGPRLEALNEIDAVIHPIVAGDIAAARILLSAASLIQARIRAENQRAAREVGMCAP